MLRRRSVPTLARSHRSVLPRPGSTGDASGSHRARLLQLRSAHRNVLRWRGSTAARTAAAPKHDRRGRAPSQPSDLRPSANRRPAARWHCRPGPRNSSAAGPATPQRPRLASELSCQPSAPDAQVRWPRAPDRKRPGERDRYSPARSFARTFSSPPHLRAVIFPATSGDSIIPKARSSPDNQNALRPAPHARLEAARGRSGRRHPPWRRPLGQRIDPGGVEFGEGPAQKIIGAAAGSDEVVIGIGRVFIART